MPAYDYKIAMHPDVEAFAKARLKETVALCTDRQKRMFKLIYAWENLMYRSADQPLRKKLIETELDALPIGEVIDQMPTGKLAHAQKQIDRTLAERTPKL